MITDWHQKHIRVSFFLSFYISSSSFPNFYTINFLQFKKKRLALQQETKKIFGFCSPFPFDRLVFNAFIMKRYFEEEERYNSRNKSDRKNWHTSVLISLLGITHSRSIRNINYYKVIVCGVWVMTALYFRVVTSANTHLVCGYLRL